MKKTAFVLKILHSVNVYDCAISAHIQRIRLCNICASAFYAKLIAQIPVYVFQLESINFHWTDRSVSNCDNLLNVISAMHSFAITEYNLSLLTLKKIIII